MLYEMMNEFGEEFVEAWCMFSTISVVASVLIIACNIAVKFWMEEKKMDEFYKGVKADISDFVGSLWEGGADEEKLKIRKYIRDYWDCVPSCETREESDRNIIENIVDYVCYNVAVDLSGDYLTVKEGDNKEIKNLTDLYSIL